MNKEGRLKAEAEVVGNARINKSQECSHEGICLFFSFDIVNSTMYKSRERNWIIVIETLLNMIRDSVIGENGDPEIPDVRLWRTLGDEIVFVVDVNSIIELESYVESIGTITRMIEKKLSKGSFLDELQGQHTNSIKFSIQHISEYLSVKSTAWITIINGDSERATEYNDTVKFEYQSTKKDGESPIEYLGQDMDMGFRLKNYTRQGRLVISSDIAYILSKREKHSKYLHVLGYEKLKGIWDDKEYPIIWYDKGISDSSNIGDSFKYHNIIKDKFLKKYIESINNNNGVSVQGLPIDKYYTNAVSALDKVYSDRNLKKRIERIKSILENNNSKEIRNLLPKDSKLELHCAVVCVDVEKMKVMIIHRKTRKDNAVWEFGCAKAKNSETLVETVEKYYKDNYGVEIKLCLNNSRSEKQPRPLAIYEIDKGEHKAKGLILVARIVKQEAFQENRGHDDRIFVSRNEISNYSGESVVDFENTLVEVLDNPGRYFIEKR